ncbi:GHMP family kinase ATP-binding protein [Corallococcus aberystwythensis]|uniref:GHMP kinase n=1 Tax=Corallococcus aberystwythensis TaxID=2316722 RepID=A0A3A8QHS6_9BACT|nr:GHMP kinase [Corallococcus aberystwythensis]RKH67468.1 GHMP kinase [Corallococcus aberystwythensis]
MILAHAPLRMSFVGGGSDLPSYSREHGGAVVSATIDKYVYVAVHDTFDGSLRLGGGFTETAASTDALKHPLTREVLRLLEVRGGLDIVSMSDVPAQGTGLGSSSSFTVALLHAVAAHQGRSVDAAALARWSCHVELERLGEPIGKQDQYAAAFGGLNFMEFHPDDTVSVHPVACPGPTLSLLQSRLLTFYTGITRPAASVLRGQDAAIQSQRRTRDAIGRMVALARQMRVGLERGDLDGFAALLDENWHLKRELRDGVSSPTIDDWYTRARRAGAQGGKLLGAGGGGFLLFYAPEEHHPAIAAALPELRKVDVRLQPRGSAITPVRRGEGS